MTYLEPAQTRTGQSEKGQQQAQGHQPGKKQQRKLESAVEPQYRETGEAMGLQEKG